MYAEWRTGLPGVLAWRRDVGPAGSTARILPDGCLDLMWRDGDLLVAGPDTTAQLAVSAPGTRWVALRFAAGIGPAVLGVPAAELRDLRVPLTDLWPAAACHVPDDDPLRGLHRLVTARWRRPDPLVTGIAARLRSGTPVAAVAAQTGLSARQLLRRSQESFGYGPKLLGRIMRLQRALGRAQAGVPFATVAAEEGYADQAHLSRDVKELAGVPLTTLLS
ncbi:helix-turn-helix domain-containing protein [Spirilliplanes yamanashiensis]|uniref:helix-turn-helix domain-containing protein n=1 Tax=Spirilliplanes yamanashiensis TaxID=42233 RepID=UPI00194ED4EB|nr:helix-turn-helix domain-containing protein [Spirilliplanes yamanashiensis]MDP9816227.1 AraC-like DNA-binding protein [Spirilliplanes yamanashiensis]